MSQPIRQQYRDWGKGGRDAVFEAAVGARIRTARVAARMTQRALGDAVGIAYQKVQKYELGQDRVSVSTLRSIAQALNVHPGSFFDERMPMPVGSASSAGVARRSAALLEQIQDPRVAKQLLALIKELGKTDGSVEEDPKIALPAPPALNGKRHRKLLKPTRAVIDPLLALLQQAGAGDAGLLASLLGQALAEAERIVKRSTTA